MKRMAEVRSPRPFDFKLGHAIRRVKLPLPLAAVIASATTPTNLSNERGIRLEGVQIEVEREAVEGDSCLIAIGEGFNAV